jgi:3-oxoacyl-[acyl-carrier-protein] synthase I
VTSAGAYVIGLGAQTALGKTALACAAAVRAGVARLGDHPCVLDEEGEPLVVGIASDVPEQVPIEERLVELARGAASEALLPVADLAIAVEAIVGLPSPRPGLPRDVDTTLADRLCEEPGGPPISAIRSIVAGHSAGLMAVAQARELLCDGSLDLCLAGGVDSYIDAETLSWLGETGQLHRRCNPWGFMPGEGAGFCLLASGRFLQQHPTLRVLGEITAAATAREKSLIRTESVCTGEGLTTACRAVLREPLEISNILCDHNGEPYRADELGFTLLRLRQPASAIVTPAQYWGDVGAASGPLFVGLAVVAGLRGYARGRHTLVLTSSERGERGAALVDLGRVLLHPRADERPTLE